jgi:hypothetical protein
VCVCAEPCKTPPPTTTHTHARTLRFANTHHLCRLLPRGLDPMHSGSGQNTQVRGSNEPAMEWRHTTPKEPAEISWSHCEE